MNHVKAFCQAHGLRLNTDLGQHFLCDEHILEEIVETADIQPGERIVEIGPGIGVLTKELLAKDALVTAIEIDSRMIKLLQTYTVHHPNLTIINDNALQTDFPDEPYKIVANIPYHITSPLLRHAFQESPRPPVSMTLLMQKEVAQKICDTENAGLLTILVHLFGDPQYITSVPPEAFLPPPKVDSAVLHIECFASPIADQKTIAQIFRLTKLAFSQKRKKISNSIGKQPGGMDALQTAGIDPNSRPEHLQVEQWIALARSYQV